MTGRNLILGVAVAGALMLAPKTADAQSIGCEETIKFDDSLMACYRFGPELPPPTPIAVAPEPKPSPFQLRALKYAALSLKHKLTGLASYYSASLDGTLTATGEIFHNRRLTAAHLTLPLGTWVEVTSRATGKKIRVLVNDRGPYAKKFTIDLSHAAAKALGVDIAEDRYVDIRVIALPGEDPLPENWQLKVDPAASAAASIAAAVTPEE
ncbi:MAG TPA: septal ring lytic transglycosylase RlpA family protein [Thermoanaerobaculia bacterium]|jgi:rare lipoprotein A